MPRLAPKSLHLSETERKELQQLVNRYSTSAVFHYTPKHSSWRCSKLKFGARILVRSQIIDGSSDSQVFRLDYFFPVFLHPVLEHDLIH